MRIFITLDRFEEECVAELNPMQSLKKALSLPDVVIHQGLPVLQLYTRAHVNEHMWEAEQTGGHGQRRFRFKAVGQ